MDPVSVVSGPRAERERDARAGDVVREPQRDNSADQVCSIDARTNGY